MIEVLIVVTLVAILAAIVIPQFLSPTRDAMESTLQHNLHAMRAQIGMYQMNHFGKYPTIQNNDLPQLTSATNAHGEIGPAGPEYPYGPYIANELPQNPFDFSNKVSPVAKPGEKPSRAVGNLEGWQYDETTGDIWPNHPGYYQGLGGGTAESKELIGP